MKSTVPLFEYAKHSLHEIFNYEECFFLDSSIDIVQKYSLFSDFRLCGYYLNQEKAHLGLQLKNNVP